MSSEILVFDAVIGLNEGELYESRLKYLSQEVSEFHIFELDHTFSGNRRDFFFESRDNVNSEVPFFHHKLFLPDDLKSQGNAWQIDIWAKEQIAIWGSGQKGLVLFSDLDEIPSRSQIKWLKLNAERDVIYKLPTPFFIKSINLMARHAENQCTVFAVKFPTNVYIRGNLRKFDGYVVPGPKGAHFSYLNFNSKLLKEKYSSFAHTEMNNEKFGSFEIMQFCERYQISYRGGTQNFGLGLLRPISSGDNEVVCFFSESLGYPLEAPTSESFFFRILASEYVTRLVTGRFVPDLHQFHSLPILCLLSVSFSLRWTINKLRQIRSLYRNFGRL
jgi:Glycosyltransferase family 17